MIRITVIARYHLRGHGTAVSGSGVGRSREIAAFSVQNLGLIGIAYESPVIFCVVIECQGIGLHCGVESRSTHVGVIEICVTLLAGIQQVPLRVLHGRELKGAVEDISGIHCLCGAVHLRQRCRACGILVEVLWVGAESTLVQA